MKRLILAAILIFPLLTLLAWFYWGSNQPRITPQNFNAIPTNAPAVTKAPSTGQLK